MLEDEIRYYEENLSTWLSLHEGRFVLVKERDLIGIFDAHGDAVAEGIGRFGLTSFLVRRVKPEQPLIYIPSLAHGLLANEQTIGMYIWRTIIRPSGESVPDSPRC